MRAPRILPPVWAALIAALMYLGDRWRTNLDLTGSVGELAGWAGLALLLLGPALTAWAAWQFTGVGTPIEPGRTPTALVTSGPFRASRNPIYLGMATALVGWALWLREPVALLGPLAFVAIVDRRFVQAEQAVLAERFGDEYEAWRSRVRRWL